MPAEEASNTRLGKFKNNTRCEEARRRRNEVSVEIRKTNRSDQLLKRRNITMDSVGSPKSPDDSVTSPITMSIDEIAQHIQSNDEQMNFEAAQACRKILSREIHPPIDAFIEKGVVPYLVKLLTHDNNPPLQFEAAWALTNIASGTTTQTRNVISHGAVPKFIELLKSPAVNVVEQAVWALGNIAGDGPEPRDIILKNGIMPPLLNLIKPTATIGFIRNCVWAVSNLCRNKNPYPPFEIIKLALPTLKDILVHYTDENIISDACWALSYITDHSNTQIEAVIKTGVVPQIVSLLASTRSALLTPALRTIGNIATGNDHQTDVILAAGVLPHLRLLLLSDRVNNVKEACWTISNITAGNSKQIQAVIDGNILPLLIHVLDKGDYKAQKEAVWAVSNFTTSATTEQLVKLIQNGVISPFCNLLDSRDSKIVTVVLDGLKNILFAAQKIGAVDDITLMIEECGGLDKLENIQHHENDDIYRVAVELIDTFFTAEDESNSSMAPESKDGEFEFQTGQTPQHGFQF